MTLTERIAGEIRAEMARQRLNQTAMAARLGMSQAAYSRHLNGVVPLTVEFVEDVAGALGVQVEQLMGLPAGSPSLTAISQGYSMLGAA